jgi:hypothetical protein
MGQPSSTVLKKFRKNRQKPHWLDIAEYASFVGSLIGSITVAISGQAIYAVAPLTVALGLNMANRQRLEKKLQLSQLIEISELQKTVSKLEKNTVKVVLKLRQQFATEIELVRQELERLSPEQVEQITAIEQDWQEVAAIAQNPASQNLVDWETWNTRLMLLEEAIASLQAQWETSIDEKNSDLADVQNRLQEMEDQNEEIVKPHLKRLISIVRQLQQTSATIQSTQQSINAKLKEREPLKQQERGL